MEYVQQWSIKTKAVGSAGIFVNMLLLIEDFCDNDLLDGPIVPLWLGAVLNMLQEITPNESAACCFQNTRKSNPRTNQRICQQTEYNSYFFNQALENTIAL